MQNLNQKRKRRANRPHVNRLDTNKKQFIISNMSRKSRGVRLVDLNDHKGGKE